MIFRTRRFAMVLYAWLAAVTAPVIGTELPRAHVEKVRFLAASDLDAADAQVVGKLLDAGFFAKLHDEWTSLQTEIVDGMTPFEKQERVKQIGLPIARQRFTPFSGHEVNNHYGYFEPGPKREGLLKRKSRQLWELPICRYDSGAYAYMKGQSWRRVATITVDVVAGKVLDVRWD